MLNKIVFEFEKKMICVHCSMYVICPDSSKYFSAWQLLMTNRAVKEMKLSHIRALSWLALLHEEKK